MINTYNKRAFTLIELSIVMLIIMILAGLLTSGMRGAKKQARVTQTQANIARLETALAMYEADNGEYPLTSDGNKTPLGRLETSYNYLHYRSNELNAGGEVIDAWGNTYHYSRTTYFYQLHSNGPDKNNNSGGGDDIKSW